MTTILSDHGGGFTLFFTDNLFADPNLRDYLFFDNKGQIRKQQPDDLVNLVGCLNLVSNEIAVWNTVYMQAAIDELIHKGESLEEPKFVHLAPIRFRHINRYGRSRFDIGDDVTPSGLRHLRSD